MRALPFVPLALAFGLLAATVLIHASMLILLLRWYGSYKMPPHRPVLHGAWMLVRIAWWTVLAHMISMVLWAVAYRWIGALPSLTEAFYFSSTTYTTVGFGDVLLPQRWHLLAGVEGLTGILMAGWSTAFLFAVMSRMLHGFGSRLGPPPGPPA